jgi:2,4-dienoyl-CoA reductase-like NADH-dependent reductase (Old Yellow Enzyme family)
MHKITDTLKIRNHIVKNRIAMLPMVTFSFQGENGDFYGLQHIEHYTKCAKGGPGLLIVQSTNVAGVFTQTKHWTPGSQKALSTIASNCKALEVTPIIQLACSAKDINCLSTQDILESQQELRQATLVASALGFQGVEYHFAHGFYLCQMLDGKFNKRTDQFGGTLENRMRILLDLLPDLRQQVGEDFLFGVRFGLYCDTKEEGIQAAHAFENAGIDFLDITFGMTQPKEKESPDFPLSAVTECAATIQKEVHIPVIGVNEINSEERVKCLIENGLADLAGIGRGMLADPDFPKHVFLSEPIQTCKGCRDCAWFTDHTQCPARKRTA